MNATTELIYPALKRNSQGFNSKAFRMGIETFSLEELEKTIEKLTNDERENDPDKEEKLRLCLRFRNAYLIQLPYFRVIRKYEDKISFSQHHEKSSVSFYYLNFKDNADIELFKAETCDRYNDKSNIGIFIMKRNSYGFEEIKQYAKNFGRIGNLFLEIKTLQYNHLVSRNLFQDILFKLATDFVLFPCSDINDVIMTLQKGRDFYAGRYPGTGEKSGYNLATTVELLLQKMNLSENKEILVYWFLIELNSKQANQSPNNAGCDFKDIGCMSHQIYKSMGSAGKGSYCLMENAEMDCQIRVSLIVTNISLAGEPRAKDILHQIVK